jgi:hypothetical protein
MNSTSLKPQFSRSTGPGFAPCGGSGERFNIILYPTHTHGGGSGGDTLNMRFSLRYINGTKCKNHLSDGLEYMLQESDHHVHYSDDCSHTIWGEKAVDVPTYFENSILLVPQKIRKFRKLN